MADTGTLLAHLARRRPIEEWNPDFTAQCPRPWTHRRLHSVAGI